MAARTSDSHPRVIPGRQHILIVGGGYVGMYTAYRLQKKLRSTEASITVVDPQPNMTYQPFLPEVAAGSIEARHVVIPLRRLLTGCTVITGTVTSVEHARRRAVISPADGGPYELGYDQLIMTPGSVARTLPIPGLAETGIGFKNVGEALYLRNHLLERLDIAASTGDLARRKRALTFVVVGGGYSGLEVSAELEDMARYALRFYPNLSTEDMRWVLVETSGRILPEVSPSLAVYTVKQLLARGAQVYLNTRIESMVDGHLVLSDGEEFDADTTVWTAGVTPSPLLAQTDLPLHPSGRLSCTAELRVRKTPGVWAAGDCAAVPDLSKPTENGALCAPTAQHAVRQAKRLADNIVSDIRGRAFRSYSHRDAGSVASLGLHKGVAEIYGIRLRGWLAWFIHRGYHVKGVPTLNRKARVVADWMLALLFRREVVSLGQGQHPRTEWESAAGGSPESVAAGTRYVA